ncbi:hypothetical protein A3H10_04800 [Candidatus Uhrbacteria bacterium RIFCSPLOWO2_12_FULL_46_10]|uniref:Methyltransferase domain-containing protein n=1 Tax=Candidatus Uhrbacteria bacterium RIFCSPLOWO2_01_FULL_47_25 TaxID=1802402 RepID=A0A1F7UXL8_9BACT|nr:MAG: hypothetical protein A2752_00905 [Candidatus Uhrbacteria bacterium RIFCSPHIGHO2_01_FULL_46_23]OGL69871.1 MAG: hypothetical protein A3D60_00795 [Candidatus Uhrbacteria bacterium RIFCSPHIGHO2_02_FULL_47_29]OGL75648.1 MAG: hypothetical protein A3E96_01260 [Candidatus Uhrbacteria bacterium RIFCSPHIGHO2_12_FULL_46_13]OGL82468.1 MAG: hypothetical protein A2936_02065 [Candidatus Uhrbacteria bacterium RIFCSPLOWO2_01_FULL_47_25]OGL85246.1 MAG: hypothetical protein A3I37_02865 [Candidatus Uhrbact
MHHQLFYKRLVKFYDLIYANKNYEREARFVRDLVLKYKKSKGRDLLEVACGTGRYLQYLRRWFQCFGVDKNPMMLKISRLNAPNVPTEQADMITLKLNKKFDAIVCLFSSIGYVKNYANLEKTIRNFARHLKPGGVVIIEPWISKGKFIVGSPHLETFSGKDLKIARASVAKRRGDISIIDFHFLIAERGKTVGHFADRHELGMFDKNKVLKIMQHAGLKAKTVQSHFKSKRGLYVGVNPVRELARGIRLRARMGELHSAPPRRDGAFSNGVKK